MATTGKKFNGGAVVTELTTVMTALSPTVGGTFTIDAYTGWPDGSSSKSFVAMIDEGELTEEKVLCSARTNGVVTVEQRGYDGTTAAAHDPGAEVYHSIDAATIQAHEDYVALDHLRKAGGTMTGETVFADQLATRPLLKDYGEETVAHGAMGATETFDYSAGNVHTGTLDENCTITISNPTASGDTASLLAILTHDGSGGSTITWTNGTYVTADGADPTLSTVAGAVLFFTLISVDGGTTWYVFYGGSTA